MDVVVEFWSRECLWVESYGVDLMIFSCDEKNSSKSIVWGISFHYKLCVWYPMHKDRSGDESLFQDIKWRLTFVVKIPRSVFSSKMSERNDYIWIVENEMSIEVSEF